VSIRASLPNGTFQASTGIFVPLEDWNSKTQSLKRKSTLENADQINQRLFDLKNKLQKICLSAQGEGGTVTVQRIKQKWFELNNPPKVYTNNELGAFIKSIIEDKKAMNVSRNTLSSSTNCLRHVLQFQEKSGKLFISDFDHKLFTDFSTYMITHPQNYSNSYIHKVITQLKTFFRLAHKRKMIQDISFLENKVPVSKLTRDAIYLSMAEIQLLYDLPIENKSLQNTRDLFLVGCLTGLRYSDYSRLTKENVKVIEHAGQSIEAIVILTKKTKKMIHIPLIHPLLKDLLGRIASRKPISSQKFNDQLKEVAKLAGFNNTVLINQFRSGKHHIEYVEKHQLFNSHLARRSFCTNAYKAGIPVQTIMLMTGHSSVASFMQYLKVGNEEAVLMMAKHPFFTGSKGE
jgi:site-specific recombinase XerD